MCKRHAFMTSLMWLSNVNEALSVTPMIFSRSDTVMTHPAAVTLVACSDVRKQGGHMMRWWIPHCAPFKIVEKKSSRRLEIKNYSFLIKITLKNISKETPLTGFFAPSPPLFARHDVSRKKPRQICQGSVVGHLSRSTIEGYMHIRWDDRWRHSGRFSAAYHCVSSAYMWYSIS